MEELQSTEVLDREILEDARKKAYRILKTADDTVKANAAAWDKKARDAAAELKQRYAERSKRAAEEIMARLPLDKQRAESEKIEGLIGSAVDNWYAGLGRDRVLSILEGELRKRLEVCPEFNAANFRVVFHNLDQKEGEGLLKKVLPQGKWESEAAPADGANKYPEIIIDSKTVKITASIQMVTGSLLGDYRSELTEALIGSAFKDSNVSIGGLA
ncbi:hypothetical protein AGMMS49546_04170 [Spirochaetia bacterium]|nr:hypothetical protein AGMMS49546_04170 [Spirochaetia bacterium]